MTNFEKFKDVVLSIVDKEDIFGIIDGEPVPCHAATCLKCQFIKAKSNSFTCAIGIIKWLYEEYQEKPKLSEKAYHLLKSFPDDAEIMIANGFLYVVTSGVMDAMDYFNFLPEFPEEIEDGKRYKVSDLLKFEVEE